MTHGRLISVSHLDRLYTPNAGRTSAPNCLLSETLENGDMTVGLLMVPAALCVRVDLPVLRFTTANTVCSVEHQTSTRANKKRINFYQSE